jgi:pilus assembly protein CpaD
MKDMPMSKSHGPIRLLLHPALIALGAALAAATPAAAEPANRGMESVNQPVVQRTDFVFDATPDGYSGLSDAEQRRILDWFDAIHLSYGDRVAIADGGLYGKSAFVDAVGNLVSRYGLLLADAAPRTAGEAPSGAVRIVVSRSIASVPGCPDWKGRFEADFQGGLSYNYGCATNGNLAAMIANPEDLVQGRETRSDLRTATSNRAIKAYNSAAPSGAGGSLK